MWETLISVLIANLLTLYYGVTMLMSLVLYAAMHPFTNPWTPKLRLMPPDILKHPKFGAHKYIKVNNVKIHYVESGDPSKPLMVFMHGYPEFWYSWRHQIVHFNKDYWCIAFDMRGYGDSEKPEEQSAYRLDNMVEDLRDLVRQMGREKFILVAHDWGGGIGWRYRDLYPETLLCYISLATSTVHAVQKLMRDEPEQFKKSWYIFMNRFWWVPELVMRFNDVATFDEVFQIKGDNPFLTQEDIECFKYTFGKPGAFTPPINYYRENFRYTMSEPPPQSSVPVPCLFVAAENDKYLIRKHADVVSSQYKNCDVHVLEDCGHFCMNEQPDKVNAVIRDFLAKNNIRQ